MQVDLDSHVPPALYRAIAELLAWLYHIEAAQQAGGIPPAPPTAAPDATTQMDNGGN
jgi:flagellar biosynthesis protein